MEQQRNQNGGLNRSDFLDSFTYMFFGFSDLVIKEENWEEKSIGPCLHPSELSPVFFRKLN